jgi:hypothetical protein
MSKQKSTRSRPHILGYRIPKNQKGMLSWDWVMAHVKAPRNYWVSTVTPDNLPHSVPVWGVWVDDVFYHGGGSRTRKGRNLAENPHMVMHLESGDEVVIMEGRAEILTEDNIDPSLAVRIDAEYQKKYDMKHGLPVWRLHLTKVFAWHQYPNDVTRWEFKDGENNTTKD